MRPRDTRVEQDIRRASEHTRAGRVRQAEALYIQVLKRKPHHSQALYRMGLLKYRAGKLAEAAGFFRRATESDPTRPQGFNDLGVVLRRLGRTEQAVEAYQKAIALSPSDATYQHNLGNAQRDLGRRQEALAAYRRAVELDPAKVSQQITLGDLLREMGRTEEARRTCERCLEADPSSDAALNLLGAIAVEEGNSQEGVECFERALTLNPKNANAYRNLGTILQRLGQIERATATYRKLLEISPEDTAARRYLSRNVKFLKGDPEIARMEGLLRSGSASAAERSDLHFALGKAYDDAGEYDKAFQHFASGNAIERRRVQYSAPRNAEWVGGVIDTFSEEFFAAHEEVGSESELPLFVLGMPRSGTTLVEQILASHPQVFGAGELTVLLRMSERLPDTLGVERPYPQCVTELDAATCRRLADEYLGVLRQRSDSAVRVIDKTPFNFLVLGLIQLLFPGARVIHCQRDPLDTGLSCFFNKFTDAVPFAYGLAEIGAYYRDYERLMAHWRANLTLRMLDVRYENLIEDQERTTRQLVAFCGLEWSERCLAFHETDRVVKTASSWQVRQPLYASSVGRWRNYEHWLGPMRGALAGRG